MSSTPSYQEHPVPIELQGLFTRLLQLELPDAESITIPARPTGHIYIGWVATGTGVASACNVDFVLEENTCHLSGQLTTFDATYALHGPSIHFLAECTPVGASRIFGRNLSQIVNKCEFFKPRAEGPKTLETFVQILSDLARDVTSADPVIEAAAARIEKQNGDVRISELAAEHGVSERHLRREFTYHVGIAPKAFATIKKVLSTLQTLAENPEADLADLAHAAGFYDQAHLTKVFQLYMRTSPGKVQFDDDGVLRTIVVGA